MPAADRQSLPASGLCASCLFARVLASPRAHYLRCDRADRDRSFARYPALPVRLCRGFEARAAPGEKGPEPER